MTWTWTLIYPEFFSSNYTAQKCTEHMDWFMKVQGRLTKVSEAGIYLAIAILSLKLLFTK